MIRQLAATVLAGATLVMTSPAAALGWDSNQVGYTQNAAFGGFTNAGTLDGLSSNIAYTLQSVSGASWTFSYTVANTSGGAVTASRVSGFGFDVDPNVTFASSTGAFGVTSSGNAPMLGKFELCFLASGGGQCAGGGGAGVLLGESGSGSFTLNFASAVDNIDLSNLFVRYQSIDAPTAGITGGSGVGQVVSAVPEPSAWAMMILGFSTAGALLRRERRLQARRATA